jgi:hypothetical protein
MSRACSAPKSVTIAGDQVVLAMSADATFSARNALPVMAGMLSYVVCALPFSGSNRRSGPLFQHWDIGVMRT